MRECLLALGVSGGAAASPRRVLRTITVCPGAGAAALSPALRARPVDWSPRGVTEGNDPGRPRTRATPVPLTLQAAHMLVTVVLIITVRIVPVTVHQQDGSIPVRPPDPLALPMTKQSW